MKFGVGWVERPFLCDEIEKLLFIPGPWHRASPGAKWMKAVVTDGYVQLLVIQIIWS